MKWLIIGAIRIYWLIAPQWLRSRCLFRESCSRHVMRHALERGAVGAWSAFWQRYRQCRPGVRLLELDGGARIAILADGTTVDADQLA
jgi:putative component of membrane protein insertase Oxa1/YidC/SpoIIIJ protein YidD